MKLKKELINQSLHFSIGFSIVAILSFFIPIWWAAAAVMTGALIRELIQHKGKKPWELGKGSILDLLFWSLGVGLAVGLKVAGIL